MILCFLALGSNLRTPARQLRQAIAHLHQIPRTRFIRVAKFYSSQAWGRKTQPMFCNTVVALQTSLTPKALLAQCQRIEQKQGRQRNVKWGTRTLDIDILLYGLMTYNSPTLTIPHPQLLQRDFVLVPLLEIAPQACLPTGQSIAMLAATTPCCITIRSRRFF
jgi:2-amino-4-hydroxy-6-hydroxymethyldihydropteridine diphosphokinase